MKILPSKTWRANTVLFALSIVVAQFLYLPAWLGMSEGTSSTPGGLFISIVLLTGGLIMSWMRKRARYHFEHAVAQAHVDLTQLRRYGVAGIPDACPRGWWIQLHLEASGEPREPEQFRDTPHYAWHGWG